MRVFLAAVILVGLCVIGLGFNIFFRKDGKFTETEIENNRNMKKMGIKCVKQEEMERWRREHSRSETPNCSGEGSCSSCAGCTFYDKK